ncbi:MAG: hypothetical protein JNK19_01655 [Tabrizicola sp.]|nr:hypothetical protein [Tabrizicola sp.]
MSGDRIGQSGFIGLSGAAVRGVATGLFVALAMLALFWGRMANHDIAWFLIATRKWLDGATLYVDLVEVNPPLNFYLTLPSLLLADIFGTSDTNGQYVAVALLCFGSIVWCSAILQSAYDFSPATQALLLLGIGAAVTLPSLNGVGQREQVMVLCFLPWALREASSDGGSTGQQIRSAAFAAVGMCLKPYFAVLPLSITLLNCLQTRSLRPVLSPANLVFLVIGLAYVFLVRAVHPAYFSQIVDYGLEVYGAYGKPAPELVAEIGVALAPVMVFIAVSVRTQVASRPVAVFIGLSLSGLVSYFLQAAGFSYHKVPFFAFGMIACLLVLVQSKRHWASSLAAMVAAFTLVGAGLYQGFYKNAAIPEITETMAKFGPIDGVITLSSHVYNGPPVAIALKTHWASSYPANWLVPGAFNRLDHLDCAAERQLCEKLNGIAARNRSDTISDITKSRPDLIIVDRRSGYFDKPNFDWLGFMAADPGWARVFADYAHVATSNRYLYYKRQP